MEDNTPLTALTAVTAFPEHIITETVYGQESFRTLWVYGQESFRTLTVYGQESFRTLQCKIKHSLDWLMIINLLARGWLHPSIIHPSSYFEPRPSSWSCSGLRDKDIWRLADLERSASWQIHGNVIEIRLHLKTSEKKNGFIFNQFLCAVRSEANAS